MKKWIPIVGAVGIMMLAACKEKKQSGDIIIAKNEVKTPQGPKAMQDYDDTKTIDWMHGPITKRYKNLWRAIGSRRSRRDI